MEVSHSILRYPVVTSPALFSLKHIIFVPTCIFAMAMLKVCVAHGESVSDMYGVCHLMLIVSYCHYCAVVCIYDELMKCFLTFTRKCFICDNKLVNFIVRYAVWYVGRMKSPLGCSVFRCCSRYDFEYESFLCYWATSIFSDIVGASLVPKTLHGRRCCWNCCSSDLALFVWTVSLSVMSRYWLIDGLCRC